VVAMVDDTGSVVAVGDVSTGPAFPVVVLTLSECLGEPPLVAAKTMASATTAVTMPQANPSLWRGFRGPAGPGTVMGSSNCSLDTGLDGVSVSEVSPGASPGPAAALV
jgi:hypothetical protein